MLSSKTIVSVICHRYSVSWYRGAELTRKIGSASSPDGVLRRFETEKELLDHLDKLEQIGRELINETD